MYFRPFRQRSTLVLRRLQGLYATSVNHISHAAHHSMQVWMIPSHCLSASSSAPAILGSHPLVPMKYQQLATKVAHPPHLYDAFTSYVIFQVYTFQANSKWISGFNVRFPFSVPRIQLRDDLMSSVCVMLSVVLRWLANFGRCIQCITSNRHWKCC